MFRRRLTLAMGSLAAASVLQGAAALWALHLADQHALHGRVTSDIHLEFVELSATKQRLRTWVSQALLGAGADPAERQRLQTELEDKLAQLKRLSQQALAFGAGLDAQARQVQLRRMDSLRVLDRSVERLRLATDQVRPLPSGANAQEAWAAISTVFEVSEGQNLRELIAQSTANAAASVVRERAAADRTLRWMRGMWMGTALALALAAMLLAWHFARALRRPITELTSGAEALQRGELAHRLPHTHGDEFAKVARSMNAMASELMRHRERELQAREQLQGLVDTRTAELQEALASLKAIDARRRQLFADISHELRTPTTAIRGEAEVALRGQVKTPDDYRATLQRIVEVSRQLGMVIDDLLTMARSDIDFLALDRQALDPWQTLSEAFQQIDLLAKERGVRMALQPPATAGLWVKADAMRLRQLMLLLLDNAVRYSHQGGQVQVAMTTLNDATQQPMVEICVKDEGIGIAADELPRVFDRNFRGAQARSHRADGTGLGLAIGAVLARAHDGVIVVDSVPGAGTTARLRLPLMTAKLPCVEQT
jgi:signal transduction histidine kinase